MATALGCTMTMIFLDLDRNRISAAGATALEAALQHVNYYYSLEQLDLNGNDGVNQDQLDRIERLCRIQ